MAVNYKWIGMSCDAKTARQGRGIMNLLGSGLPAFIGCLLVTTLVFSSVSAIPIKTSSRAFSNFALSSPYAMAIHPKGKPASSSFMGPDLNWTATITQADCFGTSSFDSDTYTDNPPCQNYDQDVYENWDPDGTEPGMADLKACDAGYDGNWYYQRWDVRDAWTDKGAHKYYIELEIDRTLPGGDAKPDLFVEYGPKPEHIGSTWQAEGNGQILLYENSDNKYGEPNPGAPDQGNSTSNAYDNQISFNSDQAYGRVYNGNLEIAFSDALIKSLDGSGTQDQQAVSLRCWAAQTTSISGPNVPVHDYFKKSDLTGFRLDNNIGSDVNTWPSVGGPTGTPSIDLVKACSAPANCISVSQIPGTDLTYNIDFTNSGTASAESLVIIDAIPNDTDFKLGSASVNVGTTGLMFAVEYSDDYNPLSLGGANWTYTPVSAGGGADAGYDRNVKGIRWRVTSGSLPQTSPNNSGSVSFISKIR